MKIRGTQGLTPADVQAELARGARFVAYQWCVSLGVVTLKRVSAVYFLRPGETGFLRNYLWSLCSLLGGWWGIPWGPVYTIESVWTNLRGGLDLTTAMANDLAGPNAPPPALAAPTAPRWETAPLAAVATVCLAVMTVLLGVQNYARDHMPVALVNGLDAPYAVVVNGARHELPARHVQLLELPEGRFTVTARLPGGVGATEFTFDTDAVLPGADKVTVINPDAAALIFEESTYYSTASKPARENPPPVLHAGRQTQVLTKPDFFLTNFPSSMPMSKAAGDELRRRIQVMPEVSFAQVAGALQQHVGPEAMTAYVRQLGALLPHNEAVLDLAVRALEPAAAKAFFAQHLQTRPVLVDWHRYYQSYCKQVHEDASLVEDYRRWAEENPDEGDYAYLYGRMLDETAAENLWFGKALAAKHPSAYAHRGLAFNLQGAGDFAGALAALDRARAAGLPVGSDFSLRADCLLALGRPAEALAAWREQPGARSTDLAAGITELHLAYLAGGRTAAQGACDAFFQRLSPEERRQSTGAFRRRLQGELAYCEGDAAAYVASLAEEPPPAEPRFDRLLLERRWAEAEKLLTAYPLTGSYSWFLLYLTAQQAGAVEAGNYWNGAVAALAREGGRGARLAAQLRGTAPQAAADWLGLPLFSAEKRVLLTAVGLHEPALRPALFAGARRYDVSRQFPHLTLAAALAAAPTSAGK